MKYLYLAIVATVYAQPPPCPSEIAQKFMACYNSVPGGPGYFPSAASMLASPSIQLAICYGDYPLCTEIQKIALTDAGKCSVNIWRSSYTIVSSSFTPCENPLPPRLVDRQFCADNGLILSEFYGKLYTDIVRNNVNEQFTLNQTSAQIIAKSNGQCLEGEPEAAPNPKIVGVKTAPCDLTNAFQRWLVQSNRIVNPSGYQVLVDPRNRGALVTAGYESGQTSAHIFDCATLRPRKVYILSTRGKRVSEYYSGLYFDEPRGNSNEIFHWDPNTLMFKSESSQQCLDSYLDSDGKYKVHTYPCDESNPNQKWNVRTDTKQIQHHIHSGQCLDGDPTYPDHHLQMWECTSGNPNQQWELVSIP